MRAKRTDANHSELMVMLRRLGWLVFDTHALPNFVDAVAQKPEFNVTRLVEFKMPKGRLTASQERLMLSGWTIHFVVSQDDAINLR